MTSGKRLLLVDDDEFLRRSLGEQLRAQEDLDLVDEAASGAEALERAVDGHYDVILLDVGLPDQDGRDTCRAMRAAGVRAPIIILTAADTDDDTIQGLGAGANDYVTKPFRLGVLLARVRAQMRFQPATKMLVDRATERKVRLTEKETGILKFLYRAGDRVVARDVLLHEVWGYSAQVTTHTLETHIYRLRRKIEPDPGQATILVTEEGGYRLARSETAAG
jgi:DNA-binding response OmpR family regulator